MPESLNKDFLDYFVHYVAQADGSKVSHSFRSQLLWDKDNESLV